MIRLRHHRRPTRRTSLPDVELRARKYSISIPVYKTGALSQGDRRNRPSGGRVRRFDAAGGQFRFRRRDRGWPNGGDPGSRGIAGVGSERRAGGGAARPVVPRPQVVPKRRLRKAAGSGRPDPCLPEKTANGLAPGRRPRTIDIRGSRRHLRCDGRPGGGIGRRAGFRYLWPQGRGSSSLLLGTRLRRFPPEFPLIVAFGGFPGRASDRKRGGKRRR